MRVWLVPSRFAPHVGGIETVVWELAHELQRAGDEVVVITHRDPVSLPAHETVGSVTVHRIRFEAPSQQGLATATFLRSLPSVMRELSAKDRPDVIHVHGASNQLLHVTRYGRLSRTPIIITTHGEIIGDANNIYRRSLYIRASLRYGVRHCRAITAPSHGPLEDLSRVIGSSNVVGSIIPNGIHVSNWHTGSSTPQSNRILAWGRLEKQKGFDRLLDAWPLVKERHPDAELLIAGDGTEREVLQSKLTPGASLLGPLNRHVLAGHLRGAQIAAVPSRVEAFGMSALEALAAGRPVFHSGLPALQNLVGGNGWSATHDDPVALSEAIGAALREGPRDVPREAVNAFAWTAVVEAYRQLYEQVTARRSST